MYVESTVGIGSYSLTLYYDSSILEFVSGATLAEAGILYLDGAGTENGYQHMLSFRAIQSGDASISVAQASVRQSRIMMQWKRLPLEHFQQHQFVLN